MGQRHGISPTSMLGSGISSFSPSMRILRTRQWRIQIHARSNKPAGGFGRGRRTCHEERVPVIHFITPHKELHKLLPAVYYTTMQVPVTVQLVELFELPDVCHSYFQNFRRLRRIVAGREIGIPDGGGLIVVREPGDSNPLIMMAGI